VAAKSVTRSATKSSVSGKSKSVRSNASSAALSRIHAAEEHLKEQDDITDQLDKWAMEELDLEEKRTAEAAAEAAATVTRELERKRGEVKNKELEMKRKREDLLLKVKKRDLDRQLKKSDLQRKKKSAPWFFSSIKFSS
jgi:hypothetical protein